MPILNGLEATRQLLTAADAPPRVLVLTTFDLDEYVYEALRAGASGFLLKDAPEEQLLAAIRVVAAGGALFAPSVTRRLIEAFSRRLPANRQPPPGLADLTPREVEVLKLLARGLSNAELAQTLYLSENTARTHVARILTKLGLRDRTQAVVLARRRVVEALITRVTLLPVGRGCRRLDPEFVRDSIRIDRTF